MGHRRTVQHRSSPVGMDEDRCQTVVADIVIRCYVGGDVLVVTIVRTVRP